MNEDKLKTYFEVVIAISDNTYANTIAERIRSTCGYHTTVREVVK